MKIAVFGDSFGDVSPNGMISGKSNSWVNHLALRYGEEIAVTNFCTSGSSLYNALKLFLNNQHNFDKVIFLVTSFGRIEINNAFVNESKSEHFINKFTGYEHAVFTLENYNENIKEYGNHANNFDAVVYQAVADYFLYVQNTKVDIFHHDLMVEKINSVRPDALIIQCFECPMNIDTDRFYLKQISDLDLAYYNIPNHTTINDRRHSHMNDENNIILADKIFNWIKTDNISLSVSDFVNPTAPAEYYGFNLNP